MGDPGERLYLGGKNKEAHSGLGTKLRGFWNFGIVVAGMTRNAGGTLRAIGKYRRSRAIDNEVERALNQKQT